MKKLTNSGVASRAFSSQARCDELVFRQAKQLLGQYKQMINSVQEAQLENQQGYQQKLNRLLFF